MGEQRMRTDRVMVRADAEERARKAWAARVAGATWQQVADVAGFTHPQNAVRAVRRYFGDLPQVDRQMERELWRERLEFLWRQTERDVLQQRTGAVRGGVAVAQRAALMLGLDEPTRTEVALAVRSDVQVLAVIQGGGLPTLAEREQYGITEAEINQVRTEAGLDPLALEANDAH